MNILVFGLGLNEGGVGSARFFAKKGYNIRVTDLKSADILKPSLDQLNDFPDIEYTLEEHKFEDLDWADLVIKNPAVKPGNKYIEYAIKNGKRVETDMGIFFNYVKPSQIIGVTGTKGKSTTATLIHEVLKHQGVNSAHIQGVSGRHTGKNDIILAGNIGKSVLDIVEHIKPETLVVLEISSFQLEAFNEVKVSPKWAVITNIYPDHLNYYKTMDEYIIAKKIVAKYQKGTDFLFIRKADRVVDNPDFLKDIKSQVIRFSLDDLPSDFQPALQGKHNLENIAAAFEVSKVFEIPEEEALKTLSNFKGVEFRMQLIKEYDGIKIYNDSAATSPEAAIAAMKTLPGSIVITGGMNKNMDYEDYAKVLGESAKEVFFLEGDVTGPILLPLREVIKKGNLKTHGPYSNLEKLLGDAKKVAKSGDTILFSPGATSFNLFQNEFDRGRKFNEALEKIFND